MRKDVNLRNEERISFTYPLKRQQTRDVVGVIRSHLFFHRGKSTYRCNHN